MLLDVSPRHAPRHQYAVTAPVARLGLDSVARGDTLGGRRRAFVALVLLSGRRRRDFDIAARVSCQGSRRQNE